MANCRAKSASQLRSEEERERERREGFPYARAGCKYGACERAARERGYAITVATFLAVQNADIRKITW